MWIVAFRFRCARSVGSPLIGRFSFFTHCVCRVASFVSHSHSACTIQLLPIFRKGPNSASLWVWCNIVSDHSLCVQTPCKRDADRCGAKSCGENGKEVYETNGIEIEKHAEKIGDGSRYYWINTYYPKASKHNQMLSSEMYENDIESYGPGCWNSF